MFDVGLKESIAIQKTDDRGKALGESLGGWGSKWESMTTWSSEMCPGFYDGSRGGT